MHMVKVKICALGSASQDVFISGKGIEAKFDAKNNEYVEELKLGAKLNVDKIEFATGGGATNAATTFARQGLESSFIGRLGRDVSAQNVIAELDQENIDSSDVIYDSKDKTQYSTVLLAENGERTILIYRGASDDHKLSEYQEIDFRKFDWLYVSSFGGAVEVLDFIFSEAHAKGVKIFFNPGALELKQAEKLKGLLEDVNVLLVNKEEAQTIVNGQTLEELVRKLKNYVDVAIITDGPNGLIGTDGRTVVRAGMYEDVKVVDRTGAGDAFGSGFLSQWASGRSLKDSILFGSANSTSVVTKIGAKSGILQRSVRLHEMPMDEKSF